MATINKGLMIGALAGLGVAGVRWFANRERKLGSLKDKTVLLTGGSRGLGLVLARELAKEGCRLAICARDAEELDRAVADLRTFGGEAVAFECDVTKQKGVNSLVENVLEKFGSIDILINNAGAISVGPLEVQTRKDFQKAMKVHFWGPFNTMMTVLPGMKAKGEGRIVNIASIGGKIAVPHLAPYCASKFALVGLSSGMRSELAKFGIYVTTVCPGLMRTGSHINAEFKGQNEKEYALFSIMDSLPVTSISAESAARQIVRAMRSGRAELVISPQAKLASTASALAPELTSDLLILTESFLPSGEGKKKLHTGLESRDATPEILTTLSDAASLRNNELEPGEALG